MLRRPDAGYRVAVQHGCSCGPPPQASRRNVLKCAAAAPVLLGLGMATDVLVGSARAPADPYLSAATMAPGQPVNIISRAGWGADESKRRGGPVWGNGIRAGIVHHSATGNDYAAHDQAYRGFVTLVKVGIVSVAVIAILMAFFLV